MEEQKVEEQKVEEQKIDNSYSTKFKKIEDEEREEKNVREKATEIENLVKETAHLQNNITNFLKKSDHPKSSEYFSILEDIKKSGYTVKDENAHINYLATKLFLSKNDIPTSLKNSFEEIEKSNSLTPSIKNSLEKLKHFSEKAMESNTKNLEIQNLGRKFGNDKVKIEQIENFDAALAAFDQGKIGQNELKNLAQNFLDSTELKRKNYKEHNLL